MLWMAVVRGSGSVELQFYLDFVKSIAESGLYICANTLAEVFLLDSPCSQACVS